MHHYFHTGVLVGSLLIVAACSSSSPTVSTFEGPAYQGPAFRNVLVIGVADSYDNRVTFERTLVNDIAASGASATAFYTLARMDTPIDRQTVEKVVEENGFDAVLITRVLNSDYHASVKPGASSVQKVRKDGGAANLFRYDYEELNEPKTLAMEINVIIASELFSAESRERVWSIESEISNRASVGVVVVDASDIIATRLKKDGLIPK